MMKIRKADIRCNMPTFFSHVEVFHLPSRTVIDRVVAANADERWIERQVADAAATEIIRDLDFEIRVIGDVAKLEIDAIAGVFYDEDLTAEERHLAGLNAPREQETPIEFANRIVDILNAKCAGR